MPGSVEPLDIGVQIPYHFRCPISLELMRDPVTVCTGQTYDRSSIESWVATGNTTCPVTRAVLTDFNLIPNHTLRRLIQDWCVANRSFGVERIPTPKQPAEPGLVKNLLNQAALESNPVHSRLSAVRRLKALSRDSEKNRVLISAQNVKEILMKIVFEKSELTQPELIQESLALLVMFPLSESECVSVSSEIERVEFLVSMLFHDSVEVRVNSAAMIEMIVAGTRSPEIRSEIGNISGIFEGAIGILTDPNPYPRALKIGIKALFVLSIIKQTRCRAISAGAAAAIMDRLAEFDRCDAERALATVELLCRTPQGVAAFGSHALTVPLLVKIILKISDRATEYAAGALAALCSVSERSQREAVNADLYGNERNSGGR